MAQTMPDVLFGHVFVTLAPPVACFTSHRLDPRFMRVVGAFGLSHIHVSHICIIYVGNYLPWGLRPQAK